MIFSTSLKSLTTRHRALLLVGALVISPLLLARSSYAGAGHDHGSFKESGGTAGAVKVDGTTFSRLGIKVEAVSRKRLPLGIQATGQLEAMPNKRADVTVPLTSTIKQVLVKPGDQVREGQPLAIVVSPELSQLRVAAFDRGNQAKGDMQQAEADLALAQDNVTQQQQQLRTADMAQAEAVVVSSQERVKFAQERFTKDRELANQGALPRRQMMESESLLADAKSNLVQAKSGVAKAQNRPELIKAQSDVSRAESTLEISRSKLDLSAAGYEARLKQLGAGASASGEVTITAPIAGTIVDLKTTKGESRQDAGTPIMSIVDSQAVLATANIFEKDLSKVEMGQQVRLSVEGLPKQEFVGRVKTIGAMVSGENRVIPVQAEIDNSNGKLKPGMFAKIQVVTGQSAATAVMVPQGAVIEANGKKLVFVQNGEQFEPTDVEVGQTIGDLVEVKKGLFDGDKVVTQRANQLYTQSLSGSASAGADDGHGAEGEAKGAKGSELPSWLMLAGVGVAVGGAFFGGMAISGRRKSDKSELSPVSLIDYSTQHPHPHNPPTQSGEVIPFQVQSEMNERPVADRQDI